MKLTLVVLLTLLSQAAFSQDVTPGYKVITVIESIVPGGMGRSRMIENKSAIETGDFTTERTAGTDSKQNKVKRRDIKVDDLNETKMLNFYSLTGINFQNIASNDAMIEAKMNELSKDGWRLMFVTSGVESNAGHHDGEGIFVTRLIFTK